MTRRTEPRIAARIWAALGDARTVLNVGAGAGSYEPPTATSPRWNHHDRVEAHLVTFASSGDFAAYRADPRRSAAVPLLESSGAAVELLAVSDVR